MGKQSPCILLVDDEQNILYALKRELHQWAREHELEILISSSAKEALVILETRNTDTVLIISDLKMPEMKGSDFLLEVKKLYPSIIAILLTGFSETEEVIKAVSAGIFSYMLKPWDTEYLIAEVEKAYSYGEMQKQHAAYLKHIEEELKWAGELQKTILRPNLPSSEGVEFRVSYRQTSGLYCGGDYYDVISVGPDRYMLLIGDVSGHGVKAAFVTGILKAVIYPEYVRGVVGKTISPADFLSWLNARMQFEFRSSSDMIITFFVGILDLRDKSFTYANAGHSHPILITGAQRDELPVSGSPIGFSRSTLYSWNSIKITSGDVLLLYTKGLVDIGKGIKMLQLLQKVAYGPDFHMRILSAALEKEGVTEFTDDVTILTAYIQ